MSRNYLLLRLAALLVGVFLAGTFFAGCNSGGSGPPPPQPSLIADYCFDNSVGTGQTSLTVQFTGILQSDSTTKFSSTATRQFNAGTPLECVETKVFDLKPGQWSITATPNGIGAAKTCPAKVPGTVTLNVKDGTCR